MNYSIYTIPILQDNYAYAIACDETGDSVVIDCGESQNILDFLKDGKTLKAILLTHHHADHIDGVQGLKRSLEMQMKWNDCCVVGNGEDVARIPCITKSVNAGSIFTILGGLEVLVINLNGHTVGDIGYYIPKLSAIFVGDCLFTLGCGRMFEGTYEMFWESMQTLKKLPMDTRIYGGHEYTESNIKFTEYLDLKSDRLVTYIEELKELIANNIPTMPCFLGDEMLCNPFLIAKTVEEFKRFRQKKDAF